MKRKAREKFWIYYNSFGFGEGFRVEEFGRHVNDPNYQYSETRPNNIIQIVTKGVCYLTVLNGEEKTEYTLSAGDGFMVQSGTAHAYISDECEPCTRVWMAFTGTESKEVLKGFEMADGHSVFRGLDVKDIERSFDTLAKNTSGEIISKFNVLGVAYKIFGAIAKNVNSSKIEENEFSKTDKQKDFVNTVVHYIEQVGPDIFSYDAYPFCTFGSANTAIHEVLWELPQFLHAREEENGTPFAVFLQAGGMWEGSTHVRIPTYAEISLGVGVPLLYGAKVLQVFPYSYPNDWLNDDVAQAGLIDRYGEKTRIYYDYQKVFSFVRAMQGELVKSKLKGIIKSGKYENGLPCDEELKKIAWSECIFNGELSKKCSCEITSCKGVEKIASDVQCLTGVLDVDGKDGFFVVNNSATSCANYTIQFNNQVSCLIIQDGERKEVVTDKVTLSLSEGAFALITCR